MTSKQLSVPKKDIVQLLNLNAVILVVLYWLSEKDEDFLTRKLKDVVDPEIWVVFQNNLEDPDNLCIWNLLADFSKTSDTLATCVLKQTSPVSTDTLQ